MTKKQSSSDSQKPKGIVKTSGKEFFKDGNLLDKYRQSQICDIPATNTKIKPNVFDEFRPKPKTVLKYNIEETDAKIRKVLKSGLTQIHLVQTTANYVLPPPGYVFPEDRTDDEPKVFKYFSGGPPIYTFVDEIWRRGLEKKQAKYRENLRKLQIENRKYTKMQVAKGHEKLMALVGPDWFQELSPQQIKTVDDLKNCILKDKRYKCATYTRDNIGELGLVLRPNMKHIQKALNNCFECPVEFLLILYQLMNKKRTEYSINDRLLLSAVAHLTMRETLKELHIRIPSPPPPQKHAKPLPELPKKRRYKSPYLAPFDFVPCPRKHTGVYKNKHVQHPESPYFSYISELKQERQFESNSKRKSYIDRKQSGLTLEQQNEIVVELKTAQKKYESLVDFKPVPYLLKPSIYIPCDHVIKTQERFVDNEEKELRQKDLSTPYEEPSNNKDEEELVVQEEPLTASTPEPVPEELPPKKVTPSEEKSEGLVIARRTSFNCSCKEDVQKMVETNKCQCDECKARREELSTGTCKCWELYQQKLQAYQKVRDRFDAQQNLLSLGMQKQYVVEGMTYSQDGQPVYMLSSVSPEPECSCAKTFREKLAELQRLQDMPSIPLGKQKYIISGVRSTDQGNVYVVSGAVAQEDCTCMKLFRAYQERHVQCMEAFQKYLQKMRLDVNEYMAEMANDLTFDESQMVQEVYENTEKILPQIEAEKEVIEKVEPNLSAQPQCESEREVVQYIEKSEVLQENHLNVNECECGGERQNENPVIYLCSDAIEAACTCTLPKWVCDEMCGKEEETEEEETESDSETSELRRFIILHKIPCKYEEQVDILKKALSVMAEDGFPLAKLPDSWKLPIFRLWMDLRCGRCWPQESRMTLYRESMGHWNHLIYCSRRIKEGAKLSMSKEEASHYTWAHAYTVKKITAAKDNAYYRQVKQVAINQAREFFPSTFSYELPTSNFRDCFFAYAPGKEDQCTYWRPWYCHEFRKS